MLRIPTAVIGTAAIVAMSTSVAFAGTMGNGSAQRNAMGHPHIAAGQLGNRVIVTFHLGSGPVSWAYDPAAGTITQLPEPAENLSPTQGIGVVVKKNPGSSAARVTGDGNGGFALPTDLTPGNYDIVVSVPAHAVNTKGTGANRMASTTSKPATITFHVIVVPTESASSVQCPGSPKCPPNTPNRMAATSAAGTQVRIQRIEMDAAHPPTVVVGSGSSSSQ